MPATRAGDAGLAALFAALVAFGPGFPASGAATGAAAGAEAAASPEAAGLDPADAVGEVQLGPVEGLAARPALVIREPVLKGAFHARCRGALTVARTVKEAT